MAAASGDVDFGRPDDLRDFAFRVEGHVLYFNAHYLAVISPVFKALTQGNFREAQAKEAELRGKTYEDVLELFRCIYPHPTTKPIDDGNIELLLEMAREYQIQVLEQQCSEFLRDQLKKNQDSPASAFELLIIAAKFDIVDLVDTAVPIVSKLKLKSIDSCASFLPTDVAVRIYKAKAHEYHDRLKAEVPKRGSRRRRK